MWRCGMKTSWIVFKVLVSKFDNELSLNLNIVYEYETLEVSWEMCWNQGAEFDTDESRWN